MQKSTLFAGYTGYCKTGTGSPIVDTDGIVRGRALHTIIAT